MGDMADYTNEIGFEAACYEQDILDRRDPAEMYDAGLIDEFGYMDLSNPPGLIGFGRTGPTYEVGNKCPNCDGSIVERLNSITNKKFFGCSKFPGCKFSK